MEKWAVVRGARRRRERREASRVRVGDVIEDMVGDV